MIYLPFACTGKKFLQGNFFYYEEKQLIIKEAAFFKAASF
jgi:hypothetical protein